ncbi:hemicentin-2-like isoform X2 [Portunus trituberculatus]|uniref:hemicentin-2-like isoform X2 n=1 Tax=Portunus trituberculatus TaxID=210409 RepID=UPI001E1CB06D|nr:hemicentin-2-like isoform X2 [Portunus trituberculatus]
MERLLVVLGLLVGTATGAMEMKRIPVVGVSAVHGGGAALPCDVYHPPEDTINLLLWFRDPLTTPIYRLDGRQEVEMEWWDKTRLGSRAALQVGASLALLRLAPLTDADQGLYTCRVDFRSQPTKTTRVNLTLIVPPASVSVLVGEGVEGTNTPLLASSVVGPYLLGDVVVFTCIAHGGRPRPWVVWAEGSRVVDAEMESESYTNITDTLTDNINQTTNMLTGAQMEEPFNTLTLGPLTRSHLLAEFTCTAANSNLTKPAVLQITLEMSLPPLTVTIQPPQSKALKAGHSYQVACVVVGARPPPAITWWSGHQQVLEATVTSSEEGNVTTSHTSITPSSRDDGSFLRCLAETHGAPATLEDIWPLDVHYVPQATCGFGASLDVANIKEGDDVYFECTILANPRTTRVSWRHHNTPLVHNVTAGIITSNQSLVLQRVVRQQAGLYSCIAKNDIGEGVSNYLRLDVKYAPVCSPEQVTTYAVGRYEDAEVTCSVDANPPQDSFQWTFNNTADTIDVPQGRFSSSSTHSVITYTPMTSLDYGTLLCWAANEIGSQKEPCVFHIVPAGKPERPGNCTVDRGTPTSARVRCVAGGSGGLSQWFLLDASRQGRSHSLNLTAQDTPEFHITGLWPGGTYQLAIRAANNKGLSAATRLTLASGSNASLYHLHDGPFEAEVRDAGNTPGGEAENGRDSLTFFDSLTLPPVLLGLLGLASAVMLLLILLVLMVTLRRRRMPQLVPLTEASRPQSSASKESGQTPAMHSPQRISTCLEEDLQAPSEGETNPDLVAVRQGSFSDGRKEAGLAATLLPPERYQYDALPGIFSGAPRSSTSGQPASLSPRDLLPSSLHVSHPASPSSHHRPKV